MLRLILFTFDMIDTEPYYYFYQYNLFMYIIVYYFQIIFMYIIYIYVYYFQQLLRKFSEYTMLHMA